MLKRLRNLRIVLLFINYLVCLYALGVFGFFNGIDIKNAYKTLVLIAISVLVAFSGLILTYLKKSCNTMYYVTYTLMIFPLCIYKPDFVSISSYELLFALLVVVIMISIYCYYLYIFESKIDKALKKEASEVEISKCYLKYLKILTSGMVIMTIILVVLYIAIQKVSSYIIMYLYHIGMIFSIPAVFGFIGIVLICIFVFVMLEWKKQ